MNANFRGQTRRHTPYTVRRRLCTCRRMPSDSVGHRPAGTLLAQDQERLVCQETWRYFRKYKLHTMKIFMKDRQIFTPF